MTNQDDHVGLSPIVLQVIDQFATRIRDDNEIENDIIDRLEELLRKPTVPKPEEITDVLFDLSLDGEA